MGKEENIKTEQKVDTIPACAPPMSAGEKWYNRIVYQGINYWLNLGISLYITDYFMHGKGNAWFTRRVENATKALTTAGMKGKAAKRFAEIGLGTFSLNSGGNILLIPTKYIEDNKRPLVHWLNDKLGVDQAALDGHKQTPDEIHIEEEQPKQSWPRMIGRRFLAWCATTATGTVLDKALAQKLLAPKMEAGELVTHKLGQQVFTDASVKGASYVLNNLGSGGQAVAATPWVQRYMGYAALDWIYTIITSKVLHMTNGAHKEKMPHETGENGKAAPAVEAGNQAETLATPDSKHATDLLRRKDKDEGFAAAVARQSEAASPVQLGA